MMNYELKGREIYSEKGRLVATLDDDGNPVMAPGMAGPHTKGVREFLAVGNCNSPQEPEPPQESEPPQEPEQTQEPEPPMSTVFVGSIAAKPSGVPEKVPAVLSRAEWEISTIPAEQLPPFDPALGVCTPGFIDYVKRFNLNAQQIAALVKRLTKGGKRNVK